MSITPTFVVRSLEPADALEQLAPDETQRMRLADITEALDTHVSPQRAAVQRAHDVAGGILLNPKAPLGAWHKLRTDDAPSAWIEVYLRGDRDHSELNAYQRLYGGEVVVDDSDGTRYAELTTVVDGVSLQVWTRNALPQVNG
jgi:hypothetical protein